MRSTFDGRNITLNVGFETSNEQLGGSMNVGSDSKLVGDRRREK